MQKKRDRGKGTKKRDRRKGTRLGFLCGYMFEPDHNCSLKTVLKGHKTNILKDKVHPK